MPTATDLVTDLPADFEVFGQAVATSMADLLGGTTGQVLAKTSATDMDFTWTTPQVGDITGVTAGTGISGGGTSGTVTVTNDMATTITTAGDVLQGTGSGTYARLAIGTSGQVLTVNSGATALQYSTPSSGGMTLINSGGTTLTGASVLVSSIPATYKHLCVIIRNFIPATDNAYLNVRYNDDSTANRHRGNWGYFSTAADGATGYTFDSTSSRIASNNDNAVGSGLIQAWFFDYANTTTWKSHSFQSLGTDATTTTSFNILSAVGQYNQTGAISSLRFLANTGNLTSGTVFVYGVS